MTGTVTSGSTTGRRPPRVFGPGLNGVGLLVGAVFFALSLFPSLLPRSALQQGVLSGITLAMGYGIGAGLSALWRYLQVPTLRGRTRTVVLGVLLAVAAVGIALAVWRYVGWQNDLRALFGMQATSPRDWPVLGLVAFLVASVLLLVARALRSLVRVVARWLTRLLPRRLANVLGAAIVLLVMWGLVTDVLVDGFWDGTNAVFQPQNLVNKPGVGSPPTSPLRSGGPGSAASWDSLGREGRAFVTLVPTAQQLQDAAPQASVQEPIRVYAGIDSADTVQGRADLVLTELQRTQAFSRKVLVLATTTGSGFLEPGGVDPVEYLWHGDTAIAGVQYSYLPSWLSLLADQDDVQQTSQTVFRTVYDYWNTLPETSRPNLYLYGLSLGSFGVQSVLTSIELLNQPIDGALMVGPPFVNELHQRLTAQRDPGSPVWRPVYQDGRTVRFTTQKPVLDALPGPWGPSRVAYLQHGSDPIVFFSPDLLLEEPEWLAPGQRAPDVSPEMRWTALVTMCQVLLDLPGAGNVPWGYGHLYKPSENTFAWAAVSRPPGWPTEALAALAARLDATTPAT